MLKHSSTLAVSVPINLSIELGFVSVNDRRETYVQILDIRGLWGLKLPDICLTNEEKPRKNLTQEIFPDRGWNPVPLRDKRACYHLLHSGG